MQSIQPVRWEDLRSIEELSPHPFPWPRDSWVPVPIAGSLAFSAIRTGCEARYRRVLADLRADLRHEAAVAG